MKVPTDNPAISVVMSVYNSEKYLTKAIESILDQAFADFEFIIINDGSTDSSLSIIESYMAKDDRIVLISRENKGLPASLNEGIAIAKGKYIARMDADDIALRDRFKKQMKALTDHSVDLVFSHANLIDDKGEKICRIFTPDIKTVLRCLFRKNYLIHPTVIMTKGALKKVGGYNESYKNGQDWDLWKRLKKAGAKFIITEEALLNYRYNFNGITMVRLGKSKDNINYEYSKACLRNFDTKRLRFFIGGLSIKYKLVVLCIRFFRLYKIKYMVDINKCI